MVTFEPLRTLVGYQGSINAWLLNGQADAYDSPDDQGPNQEWWVQMTLLIDPSFQVVIAVSDKRPTPPRGLDAGCVVRSRMGC